MRMQNSLILKLIFAAPLSFAVNVSILWILETLLQIYGGPEKHLENIIILMAVFLTFYYLSKFVLATKWGKARFDKIDAWDIPDRPGEFFAILGWLFVTFTAPVMFYMIFVESVAFSYMVIAFIAVWELGIARAYSGKTD